MSYKELKYILKAGGCRYSDITPWFVDESVANSWIEVFYCKIRNHSHMFTGLTKDRAPELRGVEIQRAVVKL